ncbi:AbfB domain-containing protein [Kitasatospora sp. NPDC057223]|uniref:AbfB domain-containing protein n=1 Tax=Kitasatospora sp. NPDC057223 TaxID=3346055 RepID=UPI0036287933
MSNYFTWPLRFRSVNYPQRFIRHQNFLAFLGEDLAGTAAARDGIFWLVPGLADERFYSIQATGSLPGKFYLRHHEFRLKLQEFHPGDTQFAKDATFELTPPLAIDDIENNGISLRSYNFPDRYLRHSNFEIWLHPTEDSDTFRKDSSFRFSDTRN